MLIKYGKKVILTQIVIIAVLILSLASIGPLSNLINKTANQYATVDYNVKK